MTALHLRWPAIALAIGLTTIMLSGCVADGGGYGYGGGVDANYYEPYGVDYGYSGWGPGYYVAPGRDGDHRGDHGDHGDGRGGGGHAAPHAYRAPPASHSMPSLPSRSRSGGSRPH